MRKMPPSVSSVEMMCGTLSGIASASRRAEPETTLVQPVNSAATRTNPTPHERAAGPRILVTATSTYFFGLSLGASEDSATRTPASIMARIGYVRGRNDSGR